MLEGLGSHQGGIFGDGNEGVVDRVPEHGRLHLQVEEVGDEGCDDFDNRLALVGEEGKEGCGEELNDVVSIISFFGRWYRGSGATERCSHLWTERGCGAIGAGGRAGRMRAVAVGALKH